MALNLKNPEPKVEETKKDEIVKEQAATNVSIAEEKIPDGILGSKSDKIVLISPLGDPSREDVTPRMVNGKEEKITTSTIVGYLFKALEDVDVPDCGLGDDARKNPMSFKELGATKHVKAGETFALTRFETGVLLSRAEYNARITGEGKEFAVVYQKSANTPKGVDGSARVEGNLPTVSLRGITTSIKDLKMVDVLTFTKEAVVDTKGNTRNKVTSRTVVKGFEKWEPMCKSMQRASGAGSRAGEDKNVRSAPAEAFLKMVAKKRG